MMLNPTRRKLTLYKVLKVWTQTPLMSPSSLPVKRYVAPYRSTNYAHHIPVDGKPGKWTRRISREPKVCVVGYHLTTAPRRLIRQVLGFRATLPGDMHFEVYIAEGRGEYRQGEVKGERHKIAFQSIRLIGRASHSLEIPLPRRRT